MFLDGGGDFRARKRIKLIKEKDSSGGVLTAAPLAAKFVSDFAAGDEDALGILHFVVSD
jgi:hypothetical protein